MKEGVKMTHWLKNFSCSSCLCLLCAALMGDIAGAQQAAYETSARPRLGSPRHLLAGGSRQNRRRGAVIISNLPEAA